MVGKSQITFVKSLQQKKYRKQQGLFVAEGIKTISELNASGFELERLYVTAPTVFDIGNQELISDSDLKRLSFLKTPNKALAVFQIPKNPVFVDRGLIVATDGVQDPGNLGTIIRLCDWFGVQQLLCSTDTVDCYNPKVVQASMGSLARVKIIYEELSEVLRTTQLPIFGGFMDGENVHRAVPPKEGILVMGNEANGISQSIEALVQHRVSIPRFGELQKTESLNVATATAILLNEFRRNY